MSKKWWFRGPENVGEEDDGFACVLVMSEVPVGSRKEISNRRPVTRICNLEKPFGRGGGLQS